MPRHLTTTPPRGRERHRGPADPATSAPDPVLRSRATGLHRAFEVGIVLKGLDGLLELVGGTLLLLVTPANINQVIRSLTQQELSEDPSDLIARHLLHAADGLTGSGVVFAAAYLLVHGIVKVVLVLALLRNKLWAYPWMIGVLLAFIGYQTYEMVLSPTVGLIALTVFDIAIVALTWLEYRHQRLRRSVPAATGSRAGVDRIGLTGRRSPGPGGRSLR